MFVYIVPIVWGTNCSIVPTVSESPGRFLDIILWTAFGWWVSASSIYQLKTKHYLRRLHLKKQSHKSGRQQSEYNFLKKFDALFCSSFTEISKLWSKYFLHTGNCKQTYININWCLQQYILGIACYFDWAMSIKIDTKLKPYMVYESNTIYVTKIYNSIETFLEHKMKQTDTEK